MFFLEADFGYVRDRRRELTEYCKENTNKDKIKSLSSLRCTKVKLIGDNMYRQMKDL